MGLELLDFKKSCIERNMDEAICDLLKKTVA